MKANTVENKPLSCWFRTCEFDSSRDIAETEQGLAVDINTALKTGVVKEADYALDYNGISDPSQVIGRISDTFDAIEAERVVKKYGKNTKVESISSSGASQAPAAANVNSSE